MKKLNLPKRDEQGRMYVSYNQLSKFRKNKREYFRSYFFGEEFTGSPHTEFGSKVGEALENNDFSEFSEEEIKTLNKVTRLDEFEKKLEWEFDGFYVVCYVDTSDNVDGICQNLVDYKTGAEDKKSEYDTEDYEQIVIYVCAFEQKQGVVPKKGWVELIEKTGGNPYKGGVLKVGENVWKIPQKINKVRREKVRKGIERDVILISEYKDVFDKLNKFVY